MRTIRLLLYIALVVLILAFIIVLFIRYIRRSDRPHFFGKKNIKIVVTILEENEDLDICWDKIVPFFYKDGQIKYTRIDAILTYIINHQEEKIIRDRAINLLNERMAIITYGDDQMTDSIVAFEKIVKSTNNEHIRDSAYEMIKQVQRFCKATRYKSINDNAIEWIFRAIEIVGFILAIISFK